MILESIVEASRRRAHSLAFSGSGMPPARASFRNAIAGRTHLSLIAEWKRRSPSRGAMPLRLELEAQLAAYAAGGAAAVSVLTEPDHFGGSLDDLRRARVATDLPILRKDFLVDPRQIGEAVHCGASAALLILRILDDATLTECMAACDEYAIDALLECHDERELDRAIAFDGAILGINNRDLDTLALDRDRAARLLPRVPAGRVVVAESGYGAAHDVVTLVGRADAVLVGHALLQGAAPDEFSNPTGVAP